MFRYVVPIDDLEYSFPLTGDPVAVAAIRSAGAYAVEFWAEHDDDAPERSRRFQVFGTGHPLPDGASWAGTCPRMANGLVWHLYEITRASVAVEAEPAASLAVTP